MLTLGCKVPQLYVYLEQRQEMYLSEVIKLRFEVSHLFLVGLSVGAAVRFSLVHL